MITVDQLCTDTAEMLAAIAEVRQRPPERRLDASGRPLLVTFPPNWAPGIVRRKLTGARFAAIFEAFVADPFENADLLQAFVEQVEAVAARAVDRSTATPSPSGKQGTRRFPKP